MKINMNEWIQSLIGSGKRVAIPVMTHPGIELIGKSVNDAVTQSDTHFQAIKNLAVKYPSAATCAIMDLTVEAEAFGAEIYFSENEVPSVVGRIVSDAESVKALQVPSLNSGRVPEYLKVNALMAEIAEKPVIAGCCGPYSLAGRLFGMSEIMMEMFIDADCVKLLLDKCTDFLIQYCQAIKDAGANAVLMAEPAAGLLSNDCCQEFSSIYVKRVIDAVQDDNFSVFLHNCGNTGQCTEAMVATGAAGYHFGNVIDMLSALEACPENALVMGNIDPVAVFKMSSAQEVYNTTMELLDKTSSYSNFVLSSGCDTPPGVSFENIDAFYQALSDYNSREK